jgi:hypothetical protein
MRTAILFLYLAGCAERSPWNREEQQRWTGDPAPAASPTPWHRDVRTSLAVRLVAKGPYTLGKSVPVALEAKNMGDRTVCFDVQGLGHIPFLLSSAAGKPVPDVDPASHRGQTWQKILSLPPGASMELDTIDLADAFSLAEGGVYALRFTGLWRRSLGDEEIVPDEAPAGSLLSAVPESAPLRIEIAPGKIRPRDELMHRLFPILPEHWRLYDGSGETAIGATLYRPNLDRFGRWAYVTVLCGKAPREARSLGKSPFGDAWITPVLVARMDVRNAEDERFEKEIAQEVLPGLETKIRQVLDIR